MYERIFTWSSLKGMWWIFKYGKSGYFIILLNIVCFKREVIINPFTVQVTCSPDKGIRSDCD